MSLPGRRVRVAVVFGGRSTEHAISCVSAGSVLAALDPSVYEVVPVGITPKGAWVLTPGDPEQLRITGRELPGVEVLVSMQHVEARARALRDAGVPGHLGRAEGPRHPGPAARTRLPPRRGCGSRCGSRHRREYHDHRAAYRAGRRLGAAR